MPRPFLGHLSLCTGGHKLKYRPKKGQAQGSWWDSRRVTTLNSKTSEEFRGSLLRNYTVVAVVACGRLAAAGSYVLHAWFVGRVILYDIYIYIMYDIYLEWGYNTLSPEP